MSNLSADQRLYAKAVRETAKYFSDFEAGKSALAKCLDRVEREYFRTGWMIGYRAGKRAKR